MLLPTLFYIFTFSGVKTSDTKYEISDSIPLLASKLNERWRLGDIEGHLKTNNIRCNSLKSLNVDSNALKCNPEYFNCFLAGKINGVSPKIEFDGLIFSPVKQNKKFYSQVQRGDIKIIYQELKTKEKIYLKFSRYCHITFLPKKIYSKGPESNQEEVWDNFHSDFFVDKFLVSNFDVSSWNGRKYNLQNLYKASTDLNLSERKRYCHSQGKYLLSSRVFDAATIFPTKRSDNFSFKPPYPWSKKRVSFYENLNIKMCSKIYTKECDKFFEFSSYLPVSVSWIGIFNSLGGHMESFSSYVFRHSEIKVSSKYLEANSPWHELGIKATWEGSSLDPERFKFKNIYSSSSREYDLSNFKVGFRCMQIN